MTAAWIHALVAGARALGVALDAEVAARLARFVDRLVEWNEKIDLSSIRDPDEIREKHVLDSLAALPLLRPGDRRIADLGSGGGFPGVVLAIADPSRTIVSVESRIKKSVFQRQVARELGLANLEVHPERIESLRIGRPDLAMARALAGLDELVGLCEEWLRQGTPLLAFKASRVEQELAAAKPRMQALGVDVLDRKDLLLPESGEPRTLLRIGRLLGQG